MDALYPTPKKTKTSGRGNRKHGRSMRKPAHKRYVAEKRWISNKKKRIAKEAKRQARLHRPERMERIKLENPEKYRRMKNIGE